LSHTGQSWVKCSDEFVRNRAQLVEVEKPSQASSPAGRRLWRNCRTFHGPYVPDLFRWRRSSTLAYPLANDLGAG
jgi:hypothetical protein